MSNAVPSTIGRYQVIAPLATGGMGELFVARRAGAGGFARLVVLKRLRAELGATAGYRAMFFDEARLAARLTHPNVCEVTDLEDVGDEHYLVMPYLEGVALGAVVGAGPGATPADAAEARIVAGLLVQACDGLEHAHELVDDAGAPLGVVHRDVSPGNVFVTTDGVVKLLDFGVAKANDASTTTDQGVVKGKLAYMAPEQLAGGAIDRRADLFALGVVGWEALTGRSLFARGSASLTAAAVLDEPIPRIDALAPAVPAALADVLARALDRAPARRPPTAAALREAIEAALGDHGGVARAPELAKVVAARCGPAIAAARERVRSAGASRPEIAAPATTAERPDALPTTVWTGARVAGAARAVGAARWPWAVGAAAAVTLGATALAWRGCRRPGPAAAAIDAGVAVIASDAAAPPQRAPDARPAPDAAPIVIDGGAPTIDAGPALDTGARVRKPGWVSIDSTPYAELTIDGKAVGPTPYIHKPLAAGRHRVRATLRDGRARTITIDVPEGGGAPPVDLRW
jgi:hypothetical protein